jgi:hypothetical protein
VKLTSRQVEEVRVAEGGRGGESKPGLMLYANKFSASTP